MGISTVWNYLKGHYWDFTSPDIGWEQWATEPSVGSNFPSMPIAAMFGTGDEHPRIWVVGHHGRVRGIDYLDYDGGWDYPIHLLSNADNADLHGVWASTVDDVWVVGEGGTILHREVGEEGETWTLPPSGTENTLNAIWGSGPDDIWAVGDGGVIVHWNGVTWSVLDTVIDGVQVPALRAVWGSSPNDVWAVGTHAALHLNASEVLP